MKPLKHSSLSRQNELLCEIFLLICCMILTLTANTTDSRRIEYLNNQQFPRIGFDGKHHHPDGRRKGSSWLGKKYFYSVYEEEDDGNSSLTNLVTIEVQQKELEKVLRSIENLGIQLIGKVFKDEDIYLLRHGRLGHRFRRSPENTLFNLYNDPRIKSVAPQYAVERHTRGLAPELFNIFMHETVSDWHGFANYYRMNDFMEKPASVRFNDPLYKDQWYLVNHHHTNDPLRHDINVLPVWRAGINGSGVRISVLDDGVYMRNQEVSLNYDSLLSYDFTNLKGLRPEDVQENSHGTYCAAIAAGVANNKYCGVGVAYGAQIGGPRVLDGLITDVQEAMALVQALDYVDIYTASWGPRDDGKQLAGPGPLAQMALMKGVTQGRRGLGAIYVWAAGNGGHYYDNCNADGYASSTYTLTFGAITDMGKSTYYSEPCAAVIASAYVGGSHLPPTTENIAELKKKIKVIVPEPHGKCRETFQGTSAAAPMASGVIALVLQANPKLTWRDVQHIIIECARIPSYSEAGWSINAAGKHFHLKMGFGVMNAALMVAMAQNWKYVGMLRRWTSKPFVQARRIKAGHVNSISLSVSEKEMDSDSYIGCLESVISTVNVTHPRRRDLELFLVSPDGTISQIFTRRLHDEGVHIIMWNFTSLHFWGETPFGQWSLQITDKTLLGSSGLINYFSLTFLGTSANCLRQVKPIRNLNAEQLISLMKRDQSLSRTVKLKPVQNSGNTVFPLWEGTFKVQ